MSFGTEAFILGLVLSADSLSAAVAMGFRPFSTRNAVQFSIAAGLVAALAIGLGALAGSHILSRIAAYDHWVAFILLASVAGHMAFEGIMGIIKPDEKICADTFHSLAKVIMVCCVTSIDALGVGMSLGISGKPLLPFLFWAAVCTCAATSSGLFLARKLSLRFGPMVTLVGAIILGLMSIQLLKI